MRRGKEKATPTRTELQCPECGKDSVKTVPTRHMFEYGVGEKKVTLSTVIPLRQCSSCDFRFIDEEGQAAMHDAVCRHLGVMTPREIRELRKSYGLSRHEFVELTKLGAATIARWERGSLIQNAANDRLLFLLKFPENVERLGNVEKQEQRSRVGIRMETAWVRVENDVAYVSKKNLAEVAWGPPEEWIETEPILEAQVARICGWSDALFEGADEDDWFFIRIEPEE